jgi:CHY zinc finger protein
MSSAPSSDTHSRQSGSHPVGAAAPPSTIALTGSQIQNCQVTRPYFDRDQLSDPIDQVQTISRPAEPEATLPDAMPPLQNRPHLMRLPSRDRAIQNIRILASGRPSSLTHAARGNRALDTRALEPKPADSLPENDGHGQLRQRILAVWELDISPEEKALRMHSIMNESYYASQSFMRPKSPDSIVSQGRPLSSSSSASQVHTIASSLDVYSGNALASDPSNPYNLQPEDLVPSYRPLSCTPACDESPKSDSPNDDGPPELELGCPHYKRNVKIQCFACKTWWPCRNCHDEAQLGHDLPRHLTENMLCMTCKTPGPASQYCKHCSAIAAHYFCEICKLWDDSNRSIYHCTGCGICRLGEGIGKDYEHCKVGFFN